MAKAKIVTTPTKVNAGKTGKYNHRSDWAQDYVPHTIYYYYVKPKQGSPGQFEPAAVFMRTQDTEITADELKRPGDGLITVLTRNARGAQDNPRPIGRGFGTVPWWRISYLVVALDDGRGFKNNEAVEITRKDGSVRGHANHCFFDGGDGKIELSSGESPIWVMWTVNYMMNKSGKPIPEEKIHKFGFRFTPAGRAILGVEDNGTNMGPPVPPP